MPTHHGRIVVHDAVLARGFVQVPMVVLELPDLAPGPKLVYALLLRFAWEGDGYPGHAAAAERVGLSEASVYRYIRQLHETGLVSVEREDFGATNTYHLFPLAEASGSLDSEAGLLNLKAHKPQSDVSDPSDRGLNDVKTRLTSTNRGAEGSDDDPSAPDSTRASALNSNDPPRHDANGVIVWIAREFAPREQVATIEAHLSRFSVAVLEQAADLTRQASPRKPIAYLYAVAKDLAARAVVAPAPQARAAAKWVPPTEEEIAASDTMLARVREWMHGGRQGPPPEREE